MPPTPERPKEVSWVKLVRSGSPNRFKPVRTGSIRFNPVPVQIKNNAIRLNPVPMLKNRKPVRSSSESLSFRSDPVQNCSGKSWPASGPIRFHSRHNRFGSVSVSNRSGSAKPVRFGTSLVNFGHPCHNLGDAYAYAPPPCPHSCGKVRS